MSFRLATALTHPQTAGKWSAGKVACRYRKREIPGARRLAQNALATAKSANRRGYAAGNVAAGDGPVRAEMMLIGMISFVRLKAINLAINPL